MISEDAPRTNYTTPDMVADTLALPDPKDPQSQYQFTNVSNPTYTQVCRMIASNEDIIDRRLKRSWRVNYVTGQVLDIPRYQHDENSWRSDYFLYGGYRIQLRQNILPWDVRPVWEVTEDVPDPSTTGEYLYYKGDKITATEEDISTIAAYVKKIYDGDKVELRFFRNGWMDISGGYSDTAAGAETFHFEYSSGVLLLNTNFLQPRYGALRISYRYGADESSEPVPAAIQRLCCLMTASQVLNSQFWLVKVGMGGDINGIKESMQRNWQEECNQIWSSYQRAGSVHSMITR